MRQAENNGTRTSTVLGIVGALTAVVGAVVGVLVYLQSRPSDLEEYRQQIDVVCKTAASRQPQIFLTLNDQGRYDKARFAAAIGQTVDAARSNLDDFGRVAAPRDAQADHTAAQAALQAVVDTGSSYAKTLPALPGSEFAKRFPDLPGNASAFNSAASAAQARLVALSGGRCQSAPAKG